MESPLDPLLLADGGDAAAGNIWERVRASAERPCRLGRANALVARSLLLAPEIPSLEGESAAAVALQATGLVAWVDRCLPGEGDLLNPPRLPFGAEALLALRPWLETLSAGLFADADAGSCSGRSRGRFRSRREMGTRPLAAVARRFLIWMRR
jgi:hypothetical protein